MICNHDMQPGIAMVPILGSHTKRALSVGDTIYAVDAALSSDCMKCSKCGHTRFYGQIAVRGYVPTPPQVPDTNRERLERLISRWRNALELM